MELRSVAGIVLLRNAHKDASLTGRHQYRASQRIAFAHALQLQGRWCRIGAYSFALATEYALTNKNPSLDNHSRPEGVGDFGSRNTSKLDYRYSPVEV
jgi:hypothetical protein